MRQQPIRTLTVSLDGVSGPSDIVPPQIRPGAPCLRRDCKNNTDGVCSADPSEGERGSWAPFLPLCPRRSLADRVKDAAQLGQQAVQISVDDVPDGATFVEWITDGVRASARIHQSREGVRVIVLDEIITREPWPSVVMLGRHTGKTLRQSIVESLLDRRVCTSTAAAVELADDCIRQSLLSRRSADKIAEDAGSRILAARAEQAELRDALAAVERIDWLTTVSFPSRPPQRRRGKRRRSRQCRGGRARNARRLAARE